MDLVNTVLHLIRTSLFVPYLIASISSIECSPYLSVSIKKFFAVVGMVVPFFLAFDCTYSQLLLAIVSVLGCRVALATTPAVTL